MEKLKETINRDSWITYKVQSSNKETQPFNLTSIVLPNIGYVLARDKKIYIVTGVTMDFDNGHITVMVNEVGLENKPQIFKPKLLKV